MKIQVIKPPYTVTQSYPWRDNTISNAAKGLLIAMLEKGNDYIFSINGLITLSTDGETSIKSQLKELENAGYIKRTQSRERGRFATDYFVSDNKNILSLYLEGNLDID
jgi:DNA-binding HxlR family transcriptional regulator